MENGEENIQKKLRTRIKKKKAKNTNARQAET